MIRTARSQSIALLLALHTLRHGSLTADELQHLVLAILDARVELKPTTAAARSGSTLTPAMLAALTHEMLSEIVNAAAQIGIGTGATVNRTNGLDLAPPGEPAERRSDKPLLEPKDYGGVVTLAAFKAFMSARAHDERTLLTTIDVLRERLGRCHAHDTARSPSNKGARFPSPSVGGLWERLILHGNAGAIAKAMSSFPRLWDQAVSSAIEQPSDARDRAADDTIPSPLATFLRCDGVASIPLAWHLRQQATEQARDVAKARPSVAFSP